MTFQTIFNQLKGEWQFNRTLTSHNDASPSGHVKGKAEFKALDEHLLHYTESGVFTTNTGEAFNIQRTYAYRWIEAENCIKKFFVTHPSPTCPGLSGASMGPSDEPRDVGSGERLFYTLSFESKGSNLIATGEHLCIKDNYHATYTFFGGETFERFRLTYDVDGPEKDYRSVTDYERIAQT